MKPRANRNLSLSLSLSLVMAGHSRPKDGVAFARLCPAIHPLCYSARTPVVPRMLRSAISAFTRVFDAL
jgi:hypothetical protein